MTRVVDKKDAEEHFSLAMAWETKKSFAEAVKEYELTLLAHERHPRAHLHLGFLYAAVADLDLSLLELERARNVASNLRTLMEASSMRAFYQRKVRESIEHFSRPIYTNPSNAQAHYRLALASFMLGQMTDALESAHQALELNPRHPEAHLATAEILLEMGQPQEALTHLHTSLESDENNARLHYWLALAYDQANQSNQAAQHLETAIELEPDSAEYHLALGRVHAHAGKHTNAIKEYQKSLERDDSNPRVHFALAESCTAMSRPDLTIQMLREAVKLDPTYSAAHYDLGLTLLQTGEAVDAVQSLRNTLDLNPDDPYAHFHIGEAYHRQKKMEEAIHHYWQAAILNPLDGYAHFNLARALDEVGRSDEAAAHIEKAVEVYPNDPEFTAFLQEIRIKLSARPRAAEPVNGQQMQVDPQASPLAATPPTPHLAHAVVAHEAAKIQQPQFTVFESLDGPILWEEDSAESQVEASAVEAARETATAAQSAKTAVVAELTVEPTVPRLTSGFPQPRPAWSSEPPLTRTDLADLTRAFTESEVQGAKELTQPDIDSAEQTMAPPIIERADTADETEAGHSEVTEAKDEIGHSEVTEAKDEVSHSEVTEAKAEVDQSEAPEATADTDPGEPIEAKAEVDPSEVAEGKVEVDQSDATEVETDVAKDAPLEGTEALPDAASLQDTSPEVSADPTLVTSTESEAGRSEAAAPRDMQSSYRGVLAKRPKLKLDLDVPTEPVQPLPFPTLPTAAPLADLHTISTSPVSAASLFDNAIEALTRGKLDEARNTLQKALEFDQNDYRALFFLGYCTRLSGDKFISFQMFSMGLERAKTAQDDDFMRMFRAELDT